MKCIHSHQPIYKVSWILSRSPCFGSKLDPKCGELVKSGGNFVVKAGSCWPGQRPERPRHRDQSRAVATSSCLFGLFLSLLPFFLLWSREMFSPFLFLGSRKMINESNRGPSRHCFWGQTKYQNKVRVNLAFFSSQTRSMAFSFLGYEASCYLQSFKFVFKVPNCHKG